MKKLITFLIVVATLFIVSDRLHVPPNQAHAESRPAAVQQIKKETTKQAHEAAATPVPPTVQAPDPVSVAPVSDTIDCSVPDSEKSDKAFIYCHESHNIADRTNWLGCYGLGQDCNGIVRDRCGADYACQDQFFTEYMQRRYGSWSAARAFWIARVPIDGKDVGNWW